MFSDLTFGSPWWLWGLLALPALAALFVWAEAEAGRRLARLIQTPRLRAQLAGTASAGRRRARFILLLLGLGALMLTAAAPRAGYEMRDAHRRGLDVIVIADVSKSMLAKDLPPSRLAREKLAVQDLALELQGDRLGLVAFAGGAFLQAPLTLDYDAVLNAAAELDTDLIPRGGTNLGGAIDLALEAFGKAEGGNRAIILLSDGEPTDDTEQGKGLEAAARAAEAGVRIYTVGFGTPEGALIPLGGEGEFVRDQDGKIVHTALDEGVLTALAKAANGFYVRFTGDASMKTVVTQGLSQLKTGEIDARQARRPIERYRWPLGAAIVCLALAILLGERRRTREASPVPRKAAIPLVAASVVALGICVAVPARVQAEDAKPAAPSVSALDLYRSGHYPEAYRAFEELAKKNPQMDSLQFNAGTSAYMGHQYDDALDAFTKTLTAPDPNLQAKTHYNFANTLFRRGESQEDRDKKINDWRNAVEHYKSTLDTLNRPDANAADPRNKALAADTAYNRDLVQKRLDELLKEPPNPKKQPSDKPQKKDDKSDDQKGEGKSDENQPPKPDQSPSSQPKSGQGQSPPDASPPPDGSDPSQKDQKNQGSQPPGSSASPSPQGGKSDSHDQKNDKPSESQSPGQTPDPASVPNQSKPRQRGDFQSQPGAPPTPTPGAGQPTPSEAPEEAGKMSPAQARALLDSSRTRTSALTSATRPKIITAKMNVCSKTGKAARPGWLCRAALLLAGWTVLGCGGVFAQGSSPTVGATLQDPVVDVGETTEYQISVVNGRADSPPPAPALAGLTFQYIGQATERNLYLDSRTGMRTLNTVVYRYAVKAARAGRYMIPGQEVMVGGLALRTLPIALTAESNGVDGATPPSQTLSSELLIPRKSAYVGESIPIEVRAYFGTDVRGHPDPDPVLTGEGFSVQKFTPPVIGPQTVDGIRYATASYKGAIAGLKIGTLTVGPVETEPVVQLPAAPSRRRRSNGPFSQFDDIFGGANLMQPEQRVKVHSEPVTVEIKPLPTGKPADFSGGIGQFKLDVEAEPRRAQAGDPITVRLILSGQGNFERISPPVLADEQGLKVYPPNAKFKADDEVGLSGTKTFEQVVIADSARTTLPAYHFNYLDPAAGKYVSLDTAPVAVKVEGSSPTPVPAPALAQQPTPEPTATPTPAPARAAEDILYIRADPGVVRDREAFLPVYQRKSFWLAQGVPLAALLAALATLGWQAQARDEAARRQSRLQREQSELQRALRKEETGRRDFYLAATRLAQLRAAGGQTDSLQTAAEIAQARRLDPPTAEAVRDIFHRHDELAYSGGQAALEPVPADERRGVLATLETLGKNGK